MEGTKNCSPCNNGGPVSWTGGLRLALGGALTGAGRRQHWMISVTVSVSSVARSMVILRVVDFT